ncbi:MAG: YraN family protein [Eubacteriales bacterium]|nr:YraN family protein [Eubacteriales bacterium]
MNKRQIGTKYEEKAILYLKDNGYKILKKNFRNRIGEIDIIALNDDYICFIEVKERSSKRCGLGMEAVTLKKQKNIIKVAKYYLYINKYNINQNVRFDIVSIDEEKITLIKNAFIS